MEQLINQRNASFMAICQRPPMSFTIANNLLAPNTKAVDIGISPRTTTIAWNTSKNVEDGLFSMNHP
jgi:hypothetical protein